MTIPEFKNLIEQKTEEQGIEIPIYFNHYPVGVNIPIIVYDANDEGFGADNIVYHKSLAVEVGFYSPRKDLTIESALEDIFTSLKWYYDKESIFDTDNGVYITRYFMEV